jgi:hypothetical protein
MRARYRGVADAIIEMTGGAAAMSARRRFRQVIACNPPVMGNVCNASAVRSRQKTTSSEREQNAQNNWKRGLLAQVA